MSLTIRAADGRTVVPEPWPEVSAELLGIAAVASLLDCSARHVRRLADGGRLPPPLKLGRLLRRRRAELQAWIANGCLPTRPTKAPGR